MSYSREELQTVLRERYELERELGAGGMAIVWLARDVKHDRPVAIKFLRPELAAIVGGERFLKEIRTTANLQHPHILPLHESGESDGIVYYVMPFIEGESLRDRLRREKQLPVEDAVRIGREVASALDYAHRQGVVHRDVKPENILLHDGSALIADFGIALALSRTDGATRMTETGMSLGTPHYMSPEQAMGEREITPRSDIYSLGCVIYEMLVGEPPFTGPSPQAIIARVVTEDPRSITGQRRTVPKHVGRAVEKAISKLPADRYATAAAFAEALVDARADFATQPEVAHSAHRRRLPRVLTLAGATLALIAAGALVGWMASRNDRGSAQPAIFAIKLPEGNQALGTSALGGVAISRDGSVIAYTAATSRGNQLFVRRIDDPAPRPLQGTEDATDPSFSKDGGRLVFFRRGQYQMVSTSGGSATPIQFPLFGPRALWADDGSYIVTGEAGTLGKFASNRFEAFPGPDRAEGEGSIYPWFELVDGRVLAIAQSQGLTGPVVLLDPRKRSRAVVTNTPAGAAAYHDGYVAWVLSTGEIIAAPWNDRTHELGAAQVIATDVRSAPGQFPLIAFSRNGDLVYVPSHLQELVRVDREGNMENIGGEPRRFHSPRVSPDGSKIAVDITSDIRDVAVLDLNDRTYTRITFDDDGHDPMWLPDGESILYAASRGGSTGVHRIALGGGQKADSIAHRGQQFTAHAVTPDGRSAIGAALSETGAFGLHSIDLADNGRLTPITHGRFSEAWPTLSPDGQWLAYVSDETGRSEVYARRLVDGSRRVLISNNGGTEPVWSRDGREIFYRDNGSQWLHAARVTMSPNVQVISRTQLFGIADFESAGPHANYDVTPDGRFIFVRQPRASELIYIQNWPELARRRARTP
jgi:eukaryotic-like serine/threonine-protein kinase